MDQSANDESIEDAINPCPPEWLDHEDSALLRGDAIGDTVYTHRWILKCLFTITEGLPKHLNQNKSTEASENGEDDNSGDPPQSDSDNEKGAPTIVELETEVEDAACQLWDMTIEKDVSIHLLNLEAIDVVNLASLIFNESCAPRLTEVMVGVVANLCCVEEGCERLLRREAGSGDGGDDLLCALRLLVSTSDVPTLCEVMRLVRLLLWHRVHRADSATWAACPLLKLLCHRRYRNAIAFLIQNSLSDVLISSVLELLSSFLFICLPETGLNFASLYSTKEMVTGLVEIFERKSELLQSHIDEEQENILHLSVTCLYAFIDTPGAKLIQQCAACPTSRLESSLVAYMEHEGRVESLDALGDVCEHVTRVVSLSQLLIPHMKLPSLIMTVGRLMAFLQGETRQYSVSRTSSREEGAGERGRKSSLDDAVSMLSAERLLTEKKSRKKSGDLRKKKSSEEGRRTREYTTQVSNPPIEECGWVSPPSARPRTTPTGDTGSPSFGAVGNNSEEAEPCAVRNEERKRSAASPPRLATRSSSEEDSEKKSDITPDLRELEEVLVDYCYQLLAFWWSSTADVEEKRRRAAQEVILDVLDQCHAHEVLFILKAVRVRDHLLVPRLQEQILDSGSHQRLVVLLAHMYQ